MRINESVKTIARVREISYLRGKTKKAMESGEIPVDIHISPEQLITDHIMGRSISWFKTPAEVVLITRSGLQSSD